MVEESQSALCVETGFRVSSQVRTSLVRAMKTLEPTHMCLLGVASASMQKGEARGGRDVEMF